MPSPAPLPIYSASNALAGEMCVAVLGPIFHLPPSPRAPPALALEFVISRVRLFWVKPKSARRPSIDLQWGWQISALPKIAARKIFKLQCRFMGDRTQLRYSSRCTVYSTVPVPVLLLVTAVRFDRDCRSAGILSHRGIMAVGSRIACAVPPQEYRQCT